MAIGIELARVIGPLTPFPRKVLNAQAAIRDKKHSDFIRMLLGIKVHSDFKTEDRKAGKCPLEHPDTPYTKPKSNHIRIADD